MASKQIAYCSLEEAWGESFANLYKKDDSMLVPMPKKDPEVGSNLLLNERKLTKYDISGGTKGGGNQLPGYIDNKLDGYRDNRLDFSENNRMDREKDMKDMKDIKEEFTMGNKSVCTKFYEHFLECPECRKKIDEILSHKYTKRTGFGWDGDNNFDIWIIIAMGIFIIFILDSFVRFGRSFRK